MASRAKSNTTRERKRRASVNGRQDVLSVEGKDPNFVYRIVNEDPGRVEQLKSRDWEIVEGDEEFISAKDDSTDSGSVKRKHVGDGKKAILMRIPREFYEENKAEQAKLTDRLERTATANNIQGGYGKVEINN